MPPALSFVSAPSANAILSDLRPTTLTVAALNYVNAFLDELLVSLITSARSINPTHLRTRGVPAVFAADRDGSDQPSHSSVGALGHSAVGEAEVEIRGWYDSHPTAQKGVSGFPPAGTGHGLLATSSRTAGSNVASDAAFPVREAVELMRVKVTMFSTFAPNAPSDVAVEEVLRSWKSVGGDIAEETISPAGLWITAILEHVSEHVLSKLSQVVARDSSVTAAGVQDLYTALCEDDSVYGFFKSMELRKALETEIRADTTRRRPQRTASGSAVPRASSPSERPSTTSVSSPHGSKSSLSSTTQGDHRKSLVASRSPSEQHLKGTSKSASSTQVNNHKRTSSVLSISTKQPSFESSHDPLGKRFSTTDKAEEDFDAFLRSGETMRVSLTPSRFSTFESSPVSSPSRPPEVRIHPNTSSNVLSVPPSSSESSLLSSSTQASTVDSGRFGNYRQVAGRSWSSATKLMPRDAAIEEKTEEEDGMDRPSVLDFIRKERSERSPTNQSTPLIRTVPAVILGTPSSPQDDDTESLATDRSDLPRRVASLHATSTPVSEPGDSPRMSPAVFPRSIRSASEGGPDLPAQATFRRKNGARREILESSMENREIAKFFASTPPPTVTSFSTLRDEDSPSVSTGSKHRMPSLKNLMSIMKKDRAHSKDPEKQPLTVSSPQRSPTPASDLHGQVPRLRAQKSSSSFASGSTVMALGMSTSSLSTDPHPGNPSHTESPVKPRQLLRKPSLVRKWASQVATGDQRSIGRRRGSTPRSTNSPLPTQDEKEDMELEPDEVVGNGGRAVSAPLLSSSPARGLGLGGIDLPEALLISPIEEGDDVEQGPQAALAQLTAGSTKSSPSLSIDSPRIGPKIVRPSSRSPSRPSSISSLRDSPGMRSSPLHHRVLELAREGDDGSPSSIPPPPVPHAPLSPFPQSPEVSSALGGSSVAGSATSDIFVSADELDDEEVFAETPEAGAPTILEHAPSPQLAATPEIETMTEVPSAESPSTNRSNDVVPVSELVPLRHLLDHATSAVECQMLLDAILSQLGVPRAAGGPVTNPTPEDRVVAWLLAGREGPVGDARPAPPKRHAASSVLSSSVTSTRRRSNRYSMSSETTMKTLPALPGSIVDLGSSVELNGGHATETRRVDVAAEGAAVAAAVADDNMARCLA